MSKTNKTTVRFMLLAIILMALCFGQITANAAEEADAIQTTAYARETATDGQYVTVKDRVEQIFGFKMPSSSSMLTVILCATIIGLFMLAATLEVKTQQLEHRNRMRR